MNRQVSPFASLTGAEKQIRWLEYQSIRLPYVDIPVEKAEAAKVPEKQEKTAVAATVQPPSMERPQPPPEVPRTLPADYQRSKHSQYDAVIARLKQAELQSRYYTSQFFQQGK